MKVLVASALLLVGSCATVRHSEKIDNLKESISYDQPEIVTKYLNTIDPDELKAHVEEIASDKYKGRLTGEA